MESLPSRCQHSDIRKFDGIRCCLACGLTIFEENHNADLASWSYKHLNCELGQEIRLLVLQPGSCTDDITCNIIHANLQDKPNYEAVSYTWATEDGDTAFSETIQCQDMDIPVTKNCLAALRTLRNLTKKRVLWLDAICIDQKNVQERNHQVSMMDIIYSTAAQVLIFLGEISTKAMERSLACLRRNMLPKDTSSLMKLLNKRWFDRIWVLQEVALARVALLVIGNETLPWTFGLTGLLLRLYTGIRKGLTPPSVFNWAPGSVRNHPDLLDVLYRSRNCSASDPRDKVFAMLGLVDRKYQQLIPVDYSETAAQVFTKVAKYLIMHEKRIDIIPHAEGLIGSWDTDDSPYDPYLTPSWVPQWSRKHNADPLPRQFNDEQMRTLACSWTTEASLEVLLNTFDIEALQIVIPKSASNDFVHSTATWRYWLSVWFKSSDQKEKSHQEIASWAQTITLARNQQFHFTVSQREDCLDFRYPQHMPQASIIRSSLPCLRIRGHLLGLLSAVMLPSYRGFDLADISMGPDNGYRYSGHMDRVHPIALSNIKPLPVTFGNCACKNEYVDLLVTRYKQLLPRVQPWNTPICEFINIIEAIGVGNGWKFFRTESSMGIARGAFRSNDTVWALDGLHVPLILRNINGHYMLVEECYLHGALQRSVYCKRCGTETELQPVVYTEVIDIW